MTNKHNHYLIVVVRALRWNWKNGEVVSVKNKPQLCGCFVSVTLIIIQFPKYPRPSYLSSAFSLQTNLAIRNTLTFVYSQCVLYSLVISIWIWISLFLWPGPFPPQQVCGCLVNDWAFLAPILPLILYLCQIFWRKGCSESFSFFKKVLFIWEKERGRGQADSELSPKPEMGLNPMSLSRNQESDTQLTKPLRHPAESFF